MILDRKFIEDKYIHNTQTIPNWLGFVFRNQSQ